MIKDKLTNAKDYFGLSDRIKQGFEWLQANDLTQIADGKYFINGDDLFVNVQTYETKEDALFEAHREYADIQYMIKGCERIGVTDYLNCSTSIEYDKYKDIEFLDCNQENTYQILEEGDFLLLYPQDAHKPSISLDKKLIVKKAVVKVKI